MKNFILCLCLSMFLTKTKSQVYVELGPMPNARDAFSDVIIYGSGGLATRIPYDKIRGSAFWKSEWLKAYFFDKRDTPIGSYQAKLNLVSQEIHYIDRLGYERAVIPGELNRVIFMTPEDSTRILTVFRYNIEDIRKNIACKTCFIQELNQGHTKLLKITKREVKTADSLFGTLKSYFFMDAVQYIVQTGDQYNVLRKLNRENFFSFIPGRSQFTNWIRAKQLSFNKESDYLLFLEHYNETYKKQD